MWDAQFAGDIRIIIGGCANNAFGVFRGREDEDKVVKLVISNPAKATLDYPMKPFSEEVKKEGRGAKAKGKAVFGELAAPFEPK